MRRSGTRSSTLYVPRAQTRLPVLFESNEQIRSTSRLLDKIESTSNIDKRASSHTRSRSHLIEKTPPLNEEQIEQHLQYNNAKTFSRRLKKMKTITQKLAFIDTMVSLRKERMDYIELYNLKKYEKQARRFISNLKAALEKKRMLTKVHSHSTEKRKARRKSIDIRLAASTNMRKARTRRTVIISVGSQGNLPTINDETSRLSRKFDSFLRDKKRKQQNIQIKGDPNFLQVAEQISEHSDLSEEEEEIDSTSVKRVEEEVDRHLQLSPPKILQGSRKSSVSIPHIKRIEERKDSLLMVLNLWKDLLVKQKDNRYSRLNSPCFNKKKVEAQHKRLEAKQKLMRDKIMRMNLHLKQNTSKRQRTVNRTPQPINRVSGLHHSVKNMRKKGGKGGIRRFFNLIPQAQINEREDLGKHKEDYKPVSQSFIVNRAKFKHSSELDAIQRGMNQNAQFKQIQSQILGGIIAKSNHLRNEDSTPARRRVSVHNSKDMY